MIKYIESIVSRFPKLSWQLNEGARLRIMKGGLYGSLWASYKKNADKYRFLLTREVDTKLASQISLLHGKYSLETRGYKYWELNKSDIEGEIRIFANTD